MPRHEKPTGDIGPFKATLKEEAVWGRWDKIEFPPDKVSQEKYVAGLFVKALQRQEGILFDIEGLPENDHDALLRCADRDVELQLMEIVIRPKKASPYRSTPRKYNSGKFADSIIEKIKTKQYAVGERSLWLLLYATHWAFVPPASVLYLFHNYFKETKHPYSKVFVAELLDSGFADLTVIFPDLNGRKISAFGLPASVAVARAQDFSLIDPGTGSVSNGSITFDV